LRRWYIGAIFAVGLALGGTVVWLITRSDDSSPHAGQSSNAPTSGSSTSLPPGVSVNAQQLLDRLDHASKSTFHVRYATGSASESHATLEIWHTADRVRRDVIAVSSTEGTVHTEEFLTKEKFVRCASFDGKNYQCVGAPLTAGSSLSDPLQGADKGGVIGRKVTISQTTVAGQPATCYTVAGADSSSAPSQFCLSADNVPLRIDGGDGKPVIATNFDQDVPSSIFTPPASVTGS